MKRVLLAASLLSVLVLSGCATDPQQFDTSINNAVENVHTAAVASVTIGTELMHAILALYQPVVDTVHIILN